MQVFAEKEFFSKNKIKNPAPFSQAQEIYKSLSI